MLDFLVIGAQKSGTTWISHLLDQHRDIHVPAEKELHYFNISYNLAKGPDWYCAKLAPRRGERFSAEATPNYFWNCRLPEDRHAGVHIFDIAPQVHRLNPQARLILSLRDPVERAVSAYYHYIATGQLTPRTPFSEALDWFGTRSMGLYARHYRHWLASFDPEQILTLIFERDIRDRSRQPATVQRIFDHLGLPVPEKLEYEEQRNSRASYLAMQTTRFVPAKSLAGRAIRHVSGALVPPGFDKRFRPAVPPEEKARLRDYYRPHNEEMSRLLDLDLSQWWR